MAEPLPTGAGGASITCPQCAAANDGQSRFCRSCNGSLRTPATRALSSDVPAGDPVRGGMPTRALLGEPPAGDRLPDAPLRGGMPTRALLAEPPAGDRLPDAPLRGGMPTRALLGDAPAGVDVQAGAVSGAAAWAPADPAPADWRIAIFPSAPRQPAPSDDQTQPADLASPGGYADDPLAAKRAVVRRLALVGAALAGLLTIGFAIYFLVFFKSNGDLVVGRWASVSETQDLVIEFTEDGRMIFMGGSGSYELIDDTTMRIAAPGQEPQKVIFSVSETYLTLIPELGPAINLVRIE